MSEKRKAAMPELPESIRATPSSLKYTNSFLKKKLKSEEESKKKNNNLIEDANKKFCFQKNSPNFRKFNYINILKHQTLGSYNRLNVKDFYLESALKCIKYSGTLDLAFKSKSRIVDLKMHSKQQILLTARLDGSVNIERILSGFKMSKSLKFRLLKSFDEISSISVGEIENKNSFLLSSTFLSGLSYIDKVIIDSYGDVVERTLPVYQFNPAKSSLWSSSFSSRNEYISYSGSSGMAFVLKIVESGYTPLQILYFEGKSDVFSQVFSENSNQIFSGLRNGKIYLNDLRAKSNVTSYDFHFPKNLLKYDKSKAKFSQRSPITDLKLMKEHDKSFNEYQILAASMSGKISIWDSRYNHKPLLNFETANTCTRLKVEICDNFLFCGGEDGGIKIFNMVSGNLVFKENLGNYAPVSNIVLAQNSNFGNHFFNSRGSVVEIWKK
ncbi:hypothetical protein HK099_005364 [Clydaea vesicula]|uniref:Uncharacterized protein n=1 Tax=Clydaea vesicula TaxID=447962 RepID=A0AAD5XXN4_9FUNG|nr:hypothetical protein HK099_005364 [Clydaea vesicula]